MGSDTFISSLFVDLYKMVCTENDTSLNITIPVVMIPKSAGESMKDSLSSGGRGELYVHTLSSNFYFVYVIGYYFLGYLNSYNSTIYKPCFNFIRHTFFFSLLRQLVLLQFIFFE